METNANGKTSCYYFCLLIKSGCPEGKTFHTQGLFNKQVCLTSSASPVAALGLTGCYWLQLAALRDRTSCLLCGGLKASLMAALAGGRGLQTSSLRRDRKLRTTPRVNTAASKYSYQERRSEISKKSADFKDYRIHLL